MKENKIGEIRRRVNELIEKARSLDESVGNMISFLNANGFEVDDAIFDLIDDIKDGYDDIDEIVDAILEAGE